MNRMVLVVCVVLVSVVAMSEAKPDEECRYWCKDNEGRRYCCEGSDSPHVDPTGREFIRNRFSLKYILL